MRSYMWCWISLKWEILRIAAFCEPVLVVIFIRIGLCAFKRGRERRKLHQELEGDREASVSSNPFPARCITKPTEIAITHESKPGRQGQPTLSQANSTST